MNVPFAEKLKRNKIMLFASMTNDFRLNQKYNITMGLNATYIHGGMQGYLTLVICITSPLMPSGQVRIRSGALLCRQMTY